MLTMPQLIALGLLALGAVAVLAAFVGGLLGDYFARKWTAALDELESAERVAAANAAVMHPDCTDDDDDTEQLKPCPFCGADAEIITLEGESDDQSIGAQCVQCTSSACGAASGLIYPLMDDVTDLLRERWNKRFNAEVKGDNI